MFFVLSSGRSGSLTAAQTLGQLTQHVCRHHPQPELVLEATEYFYGERPAEEIERTLRQSRHPLVSGKVYGEANLQLTLVFPLLERVFPDAQYIWLIRDGRDVVASMYYRGWYDPEAAKIPPLWHRARLQGDRTGDFTREIWGQFSRFERCCWLWTKYNRLIESHLQTIHADRWRQVHLEQLRASLDELAAFLNAAKPAKVIVEKVNEAKQPVVAWHGWSNDQRQQFENLCGAEMDQWYPGWRNAAGQWCETPSEAPDLPTVTVLLRRRAGNLARQLRRQIGRIVRGRIR